MMTSDQTAARSRPPAELADADAKVKRAAAEASARSGMDIDARLDMAQTEPSVKYACTGRWANLVLGAALGVLPEAELTDLMLYTATRREKGRKVRADRYTKDIRTWWQMTAGLEPDPDMTDMAQDGLKQQMLLRADEVTVCRAPAGVDTGLKGDVYLSMMTIILGPEDGADELDDKVTILACMMREADRYDDVQTVQWSPELDHMDLFCDRRWEGITIDMGNGWRVHIQEHMDDEVEESDDGEPVAGMVNAEADRWYDGRWHEGYAGAVGGYGFDEELGQWLRMWLPEMF